MSLDGYNRPEGQDILKGEFNMDPNWHIKHKEESECFGTQIYPTGLLSFSELALQPKKTALYKQTSQIHTVATTSAQWQGRTYSK